MDCLCLQQKSWHVQRIRGFRIQSIRGIAFRISQLSLQRIVERVFACHQPRGARAGAVTLDGGDGGGFERRMVAQPEVIVAAKRQQPPAVALDPEAGAAFGRHQRAVTLLPL